MTKPFTLSVKALVRDEAGRYLVLQRSAASANNAGKWDLPGGKVDPGESFDVALAREVREETGLEVTLERPAGTAQSELPDRVVTYLIMEARVTGGEVVLSSEHSQCQWLPRGALSTADLCGQFVPLAAALKAGVE